MAKADRVLDKDVFQVAEKFWGMAQGVVWSRPKPRLRESFCYVHSSTGGSMKEKNGEHPFGDAGQLIFFVSFMILWIGDSFFLRVSTFPSAYLPLYARLLIMILAMGMAGLLAKSGHIAVSHEHRPAGVLSSGAFRHVRHPLYLASLLFYFGLAVSMACLFSFGLLLVMFFFYDYIASYEEKVLEGKYGEDYLHYKKNTGKWIPKPKTTRTNP